MNKTAILISIFLLFFSCIGKHNSDAPKAEIKEQSTSDITELIGDTVRIDSEKSKLYWKGTKMRGVGKHEGEIELKNGYFITKKAQLIGGTFVVDMTTIGVTDIPAHETVPRNNLNNHLKSADFFDVEKFPTAKLQITNIEKIATDSLRVSGNLTLKDVTKNIEFGAKYHHKSFVTKFTVDRFQWNIAYEGNLVDKTLVDKDIELKIALVLY